MTLRMAILVLFVLSAAACSTKINDQSVVEQQVLPDSVYIHAGNRIVAATFDTLRQSLLSAIGTQGMEQAIVFCNVNAYPLTNSFADSVTVKRTSLRVRNANNLPDSLEQSVLQEFGGAKPGVKIIRIPGEINYFKPIMLQAMCLNCHGIPNKEIQTSTMRKIIELYPNDRATNFKEGDLRGVWHITFRTSLRNAQ